MANKEPEIKEVKPVPKVGDIVHYYAAKMGRLIGPQAAIVTNVHKDLRTITAHIFGDADAYMRDAQHKYDIHQGGPYWEHKIN